MLFFLGCQVQLVERRRANKCLVYSYKLLKPDEFEGGLWYFWWQIYIKMSILNRDQMNNKKCNRSGRLYEFSHQGLTLGGFGLTNCR